LPHLVRFCGKGTFRLPHLGCLLGDFLHKTSGHSFRERGHTACSGMSPYFMRCVSFTWLYVPLPLEMWQTKRPLAALLRMWQTKRPPAALEGIDLGPHVSFIFLGHIKIYFALGRIALFQKLFRYLRENGIRKNIFLFL